MARIIPPTGLKEVAVRTERGTKVYKAGRDGIINVDNARHAAQMKAEGLGEASLAGGVIDHSLGFTCNQCGFGSWFRKCSRCGAENERIERDGTVSG